MMIALATPILRIMLQNGTMPESALDHVYYSEDMKENINCASIKNSATDHLPVIINYKIGKKNHKVFAHQVTKRCFLYIKAMTSQNRKLVENRFQNTKTRQNERGILCWRLLFQNTRTRKKGRGILCWRLLLSCICQAISFWLTI